MRKNKPTEEQNKAVAALIRERRDILGISQIEVAARAGVCNELVGRFERRERELLTARFKTVTGVLDALGINATEFAKKYVEGC